MNRVDKVIFDALAARRTVVLPEVGSLDVKRRKPKRISETEIIPPQNVVVFDPAEIGGESVPSLLVKAGEAPSDTEARAAYDEWLAGARSSDGGSVAIDGVGEIKDGKFFVAGQLHSTLNPNNEEGTITMEREKKKSSLWIWLLVGLVLAALVVGGLYCWKHGCFDCGKRDRNRTEVTAPVADPATEPVTEPVAEPVAVPAGPRWHVIAGSFAIDSNADNYMAKLKREHPELTVEKLVNPSNGHSLVSIYSGPTEREAYNKMNAYWDIDLYLWVYKQK